MENLKLIKQWIFDNHEHHAWISGDYITDETPSECENGDKPYVDSLALEEFINELIAKGEIE